MMIKNKFLIILPSWIGDIVISQALLKKIREIHENCKIDVVVKSCYKPLVELMPEILLGKLLAERITCLPDSLRLLMVCFSSC